ncbi:MAG: pyrimidine-nucleoside phosphorylase, partial [Dethiobacteria bacterium]
CQVLGSWMLLLGGKATCLQEGRKILEQTIASGAALDKLRELIRLQHGDTAVVDDFSPLPRAKVTVPVKAVDRGYVHRLRAETVGRAAMALGAGRETKDDPVDLAVGVVLVKKVGDRVDPGDELAMIHLNCAPEAPLAAAARGLILEAYEVKPAPVAKPQLIFGYVDRAGRHRIF